MNAIPSTGNPTATTAAPFPETVETATAARFAQAHFGQANVGHKARRQALLRAAEQICRHPGGTLPNKFGSPKDYHSMDRLMNRPEVTHARVLQPHLQRTRQQMEASTDVVLVLHDTTELDYSGLKSIQDLGPIGNGGGRGYLCHNALAVVPAQKEVLGLAHQILHTRRRVGKKETLKRKRARQDRESRLWSNAVKGLGAVPEGKCWVDVADRGADIFEFLATEDDLGRACLVRATHNRNILIGHEGAGTPAKLFDHLRSLAPAETQRSKKVHDEKSGEERIAILAIRYGPVRLCPPRVRRGEYQPRPLAVWGVHVREVNPPKNGQAVEWMLLSNRVVASTASAWEKSDWYGCRPMVEEYHKCQKTGCQIEDLQFETSAALQPMIALLSVVAVMLLQLREAFRRADAETRPATDVVDPIYEEVRREWRYQGRSDGAMTVKQFYLAVARLGGHMNRKRDGAPGWLVLWRGWMKLQSMVDGVEAERRRQKRRQSRSQIHGET